MTIRENPTSEAINIEKVKSFWDSQPCNIKHSAKTLNSKEYFDEVEERKYFVEPHILKFADFEIWKNKSVLEVGCGIGTDGVNFARKGANYTGIDLSTNSIEIAKKRFAVFGLTGDFYESNIENPVQPYFLKKYDLVYSFGVLHHTPNIDLAFRNIRKMCKVGSKLKLMVYARNSWKYKLIQAGLEQPEAQKGCPIANTYTESEISQILQNHNFSIDVISQDHIFPYNVAEYKNYRYIKEPWFQQMPDELFRTLEMSFGWHLLINAHAV